MWTSQPVADTGKFELCYRSPRPGFAGIVEVQVVAVSPEGEQTAAYAPDQLVLIPSPSSCTPSAKLCCDAAATQPAAAGAAAPDVDMAAAPTGTLTQAVAMPTQPAPAASSGCAVSSYNDLTGDLWCALILLLVAAGSRLRTSRKPVRSRAASAS